MALVPPGAPRTGACLTMTDVFISYARNDVDTARRFADAFTSAGLDVWWDNALQAGEIFDQAIESALRSAKAVVVLWSPDAVDSRWVRAEATLADRNKTLVPAIIEQCSLPIVFELTQTPDLSRWRGDSGDAAWRGFLADVQRLVSTGPATSPTTAELPKRPLPALDQVSIVVLPFANMSGDAEQEYFADGITEDVITDLSKVSKLLVIARNTAFTFKGKSVDIAEVARQLNVTHVLEGSVRKAGNRVRVTAQLIDGSTGGHVWADRYDRNLDDIFELQDELSHSIVDALKVKLIPAERKAIEDRGTDDPEAYDLYRRGRALHGSLAPDSLLRAIAVYRKAVALDPEFALGWAGLSDAINQIAVYGQAEFEAMRSEADEALERATALAPTLGDLNSSRAYRALANYDWHTLETCLAAWDGRHRDPWGIFSGALLTLGRAQQGADRQAELCRTDPLSMGVSFMLQYQLSCAGRAEEAEKEYERCKDLPGDHTAAAWRATVRAMAERDLERVKRRYTGELWTNPQYMPYRAELIEVIDRPAEALKVLRSAATTPSCKNGLRQASIAAWAAFYGDLGMALAALKTAFVELRGFTLYEIWQPVFADVRRDPLFKEIVREVGLLEHWRQTGNWGDFARPIADDDFEVIG